MRNGRLTNVQRKNNRQTTEEQREYNRTTTEQQPNYNGPTGYLLQHIRRAIRTAQARPGNLDQDLPARMPGALPQRSARRNGTAAQVPRPASEFCVGTFAPWLVILAFLHGVGSITMGRTQTIPTKP
jgi:hypothetical protein